MKKRLFVLRFILFVSIIGTLVFSIRKSTVVVTIWEQDEQSLEEQQLQQNQQQQNQQQQSDEPWNTTNIASTLTTPNTNTFHNDNTNPNTNLSICFVTSVYAKWAAHADKLQNVLEYTSSSSTTTTTTTPQSNNNDDFHFYVYTNLQNLKVQGWTKIIKRFTTYKRFITQSRWPKFMAWTDPTIMNRTTITTTTTTSSSNNTTTSTTSTTTSTCHVIFYLDSIGHLIGTPDEFRQMARDIYHSPIGLAQYKHRGGGGAMGEFRRIEVFQKDVMENIQASKQWMIQKDGENGNNNNSSFRLYNCTLYENRYFGYRATTTSVTTTPFNNNNDNNNNNHVNDYFQQAATMLWDHYSLEEDSWRDQPLWCFVLDYLNITPIELRHKQLFKISTRRMGKIKHRYDWTADNDAQLARQERQQLKQGQPQQGQG